VKSLTEYVTFNTQRHRQYVNITDRVAEAVARSGVREGMVLVSVYKYGSPRAPHLRDVPRGLGLPRPYGRRVDTLSGMDQEQEQMNRYGRDLLLPDSRPLAGKAWQASGKVGYPRGWNLALHNAFPADKIRRCGWRPRC
jgi:hypothetical protein